MLHLDRGVADDPQQLLVAPDVVLARGDVQVADQDRPPRRLGPEGVAHRLQIVELLPELGVQARGRECRRRRAHRHSRSPRRSADGRRCAGHGRDRHGRAPRPPPAAAARGSRRRCSFSGRGRGRARSRARGTAPAAACRSGSCIPAGTERPAPPAAAADRPEFWRSRTELTFQVARVKAMGQGSGSVSPGLSQKRADRTRPPRRARRYGVTVYWFTAQMLMRSVTMLPFANSMRKS